MKIKLVPLFALLVLVGMLLTACGSVVAPTAAPRTTEAPATQPLPAETEVPGEPATQVGTLRIWADDTRAPVLQDLADKVMAAYHLQLVVELKSSLRDDFQAAALLGDGPDIIVLPAHDQASTLVANGFLAPVHLDGKEKDFDPKALEACTFNGVLYCLPYATENLGFFYNADLVKAPPKTWDEVASIGEALKEQGKVDYIMAVTGTTYDLYPLFTSFGGYIFGKDSKGNWNPQDIGLDKPGMIKGVQWLVDHVKNGDLPLNWEWADSHILFETGKVPFIMVGPWALDRIRMSGVPYKITKFPSRGHPFAETQGFFINAQSKNALLAQDFLNRFIANEDTMIKLSEVSERPSAYLPALAKIDDPDLKAFAEAGKNAAMIPAIPAMSSVWVSWNDAVVLARDGKQDPETALKEADTEIRTLINKR